MEFKRIDVHQVHGMMAEDTPPQIVDIRDEQSYLNGHLEAAVHLDNSSVQTFIQQADFDRALVVYCYHGNMSQSAAAYFSEQGFEEAYSMDGGFSDWELQYADKVEKA